MMAVLVLSGVPVPVSLTAATVRATLPVMLNAAVAAPVTLGKNVTLIVHVAPAEIATSQSLAVENDAAPVPVSVTADTDSGFEPVFFKVML